MCNLILASVCLACYTIFGVIIMGKTSSVVKNRYNAKAYDRFIVTVKKGKKEKIQAYAAALGKSLNGYIVDLIDKDMAKDNAKKEA